MPSPGAALRSVPLAAPHGLWTTSSATSSASVPPPGPDADEDRGREDQRAHEERAVPDERQAEAQEQRGQAEQRVEQGQREQRRLHAAPERIDEVRGDHDEEQDRRRALDEPRPHAAARVAPALQGRPLAAEGLRRGVHSRLRTVRPSAITRRTASSALTSTEGSPSTAMRSAPSPGATQPVSSSRPSTFAATDVAERITCSGSMPAVTMSASSGTIVPCGFSGVAAAGPAANTTPAGSRRRERAQRGSPGRRDLLAAAAW